MFRKVSLGSPRPAFALGWRSPGANASNGGSTHTQLKNENGARFGCPVKLIVDTHAIGRGATELSRMPYSSLCERFEGVTIIPSSITFHAPISLRRTLPWPRLPYCC